MSNEDREPDLSEARRRGYEDGRLAIENCDPYPICSDLSNAYTEGWDTGYEEYESDHERPA